MEGPARTGPAGVGTTSVVVFKANAERTAATFVNDSPSVIYLRLGDDAVVNTGIRLNRDGGSFEINELNMFYGPVSAIGAAAGLTLCSQEW